MTEGTVLWEPSPRRAEDANVARYREWLAAELGVNPANATELWRWSVGQPGPFWDSIWEFCAVQGERGQGPALADPTMPTPVWFPGARVNYAENALTRRGRAAAIIAVREDGATAVVSWNELRRQVARAAAGLRGLGVRPGDRIAAVLPNTVHAVVAMLASASVGAVWSSCSPQLGTAALAERFARISPKVLIGVDGFTYGGKAYDAVASLAELARELPSLTATVLVPYLSADAYARAADGSLPGLLTWDEMLAGDAEPDFLRLPFDAPLWILYEPGPDGGPEPIVHGHGGILLEHLKALVLHLDLGPDDRFCWYADTGAMAWHLLVSGLLAGATAVLYDGSPAHPDLSIVWRMAEAVEVTCLGLPAELVDATRLAGVSPSDVADLGLLRTLAAAGSGLPPEAYAWVLQAVSPQVLFCPMFTGTDVCAPLLAGLPTEPVRAGEIGSRALGCAVSTVDPAGREVVGRVGELVSVAPMPSMAQHVWGDHDGSRLRELHTDGGSGLWRHHAAARLTPWGSAVVADPAPVARRPQAPAVR